MEKTHIDRHIRYVENEIEVWVEIQAYHEARKTWDGEIKYCSCKKTTKYDYVSISDMKLFGYATETGWTVEGYPLKMELYFKCPDCGYCWVIEKLGVPRSHVFKRD